MIEDTLHRYAEQDDTENEYQLNHLELDSDDATDDVEPDDHHEDRADPGDLAERGAEERVELIRVEQHDEDEDADGYQCVDDGRELALGG